MRARLITCLAIFAVMALSNAVVPLLPQYGEGATIQGFVYAAYFFGAFSLTIPAGVLSDRFGNVTVMRSGLVITVMTGAALSVLTDPVPVIAIRLLEGFGAGLFVAAAMAYINSLPDHEVMSGYYMASLNAGLVFGLVISGYLAVNTPGLSGIMVFTAGSLLAMFLSFTIAEPATSHHVADPKNVLIGLIRDYYWFWYAAIVLVGITGVAISLYPEFSPAESDIDSIWIAVMSFATILATLVASRMNLPPGKTIRVSAMVMAMGILTTLYTPVGFLIIGTAAGVVMIAQMAFLAEASTWQGAAMGLFSTTSYLGMGLLPSAAGIFADAFGYFITFLIFSVVAISAAVTIGWCSCRVPTMPKTG